MKRFQLTSDEQKYIIFEIVKDILREKEIQCGQLELSYCYQNGKGTYSHFLVNWGTTGAYITLIADDQIGEWYGFRLLNMKDEYKIIDVR